MPRQGQGPKLYWRGARRDTEKRLTHKAHWVIRDGSRELSTGFGIGESEQAQKALAAYIVDKYQPQRERGRDPASILVADVIGVWLDDKAPSQSRPEEAGQRATTLLAFFKGKMLSSVNEEACKCYAASRSTMAAARRELEDLRAAIIHYHRQGYCAERMTVWLPERSPRRERWLFPDEAAAMLWALWRAKDPLTGIPTRRHAARFFLVALYTGTRSGAVCAAAIRPTVGSGYIDLDAGLFYRKAPEARETKKRQPPVTLPERLAAHLRRWERRGIARNFVVEHHGKPVKSIKKAWSSARVEAGLDKEVTPHTLRHTAATWLMLNGTEIGKAADFLGMSVSTLHKHYRHHHPNYQREAAANISRPPQFRPRLTRTDQEHSTTKRKANACK
jgi:integrase